MTLKKYQQKTIDTLNDYLAELKNQRLDYAFMHITQKPYKKDLFNNAPFVCIKIPTGGGKTLVATHSIGQICDTILSNKMDRGIVMWFVPSEAIKSQTLNKLKNRTDLHRKVLDEAFDNKVRIFAIEEALRIRKEDVESSICIIISSLDAFRKDKSVQNKYKVYQENGELINHFEHLQENKNLEKDEEGTVINSLANVIRINNPLIIIDEGHHAQTQLSIDFLKELSPAFILEFTATPRDESNILVQISSAELKEEKMVKIPIILESVSQWQQAVTRGISKRNELEIMTKKEKGEYIRPIALLQAEQEKENPKKITVAQIKEFLIKEHKIPEEQIAVKTATTNDIEGIDLLSKKCAIRYIITVNALAEGWDCPYAYLLISVANIGSRISVEQIIGRIVRLPYLKEKTQKELNNCYIFASAKNFNEAANQIIAGLEKNGYSKHDVVSISDKDKKDDCEIERVIKEDVAIPMMAFENAKLDFADLIGEEFELSKQNHEFEFDTHYDNDGRIKIDITEGDKWFKERQTTLNVVYKDKNFSKEELIVWLDKKLRFTMIDPADKRKFIEKSINYQLNKHTLSELSVNRFVLRDKLNAFICIMLEEYTKKKYDNYLGKKITVKPFDKYNDTIIISDPINQKFKKNYYEQVSKLNNEELTFLERLDSEALPNIKFWIRNREKQDPFYIQGWKKNKFYPDFVTITKKGNIIALEWKGLDRISNEDTEYKVDIAQNWTELGKGKLHFFLVSTDNVEDVLNEVKHL